MKYYGKIIIRTALLGLISIGSTFAQASPGELYVMSYNINADQPSWDAGRKNAVIAQIDAVDPDIAGLQEATALHKEDIADAFKDKYELIDFNSGYSDRNFEAVLVRRGRLKALLSGAVAVPLKCEDEGVGDRFVNWALLYDNDTRQPFMFYNNHFCTHDEGAIGVSANEIHAIVLSQLITAQKEFGGIFAYFTGIDAPVFPAIITGSLNAHRAMSSTEFLLDNAPILGFSHDLDIADTWELANPGVAKPPTMMSMTMLKKDVEENAVDYVLVAPAMVVPEAQVFADHGYMASKGTYASDNFAVTAKILL